MTALLKPLLRRIDFGTPLKDTASLSLDFVLQQYYAQGLGATFGGIVTFTRASTGTHFDATGNLVSAATNAPRFDYDPVTLQPRGLLIEEARTNLLRWSEEFDNVVWSKLGDAVITPNTGQAPSGTMSADRLQMTTSGVGELRAGNALLGADIAHTFSVYLRSSSAHQVRLAIWNSVSGIVNGPIITLTTGFQRYSLTHSPSNGGSVQYVYIKPVSASVDAEVWGAQLEAGAFPTSYIPTVASQVTRAADVASVNTLSPWYNATEGTLFVEGSSFGLGSTSASWAAAFTDGTANNYIAMRRNASGIGAGVVVGGAAQASFAPGYTNASNTKLSLSVALNDFRLSKDGAAVLADTAGTVPAVSNLLIGAEFGSAYWNGHIRSIRYFPRKLSNSELQAITV